MSTFLPNSPTSKGGPFSLNEILSILFLAHLDTTEDYINRLALWREHGAITEAVHHQADQALMQQAEQLRTLLQSCGHFVPAAIR